MDCRHRCKSDPGGGAERVFSLPTLQGASRKFYVEIFGFETSAHCPPGAVVFKTEPVPLALREPLRSLPEAGPLGVGMVLWIACPDPDVLHDLIVERGGAIISPLADGPFGRVFVAGDPDGYAITFHTARS